MTKQITLAPPFKIIALCDENGDVTESREELDMYLIEDISGVRAKVNAEDFEAICKKVPQQ